MCINRAYYIDTMNHTMYLPHWILSIINHSNISTYHFPLLDKNELFLQIFKYLYD